MRLFRKFIVTLLAVCVIAGSMAVNVSAATEINDIDKGYWSLQEKFNTALESGDTTGIITWGEAILSLFLKGESPAVKAAQWKANGDLELHMVRTVAPAVAEAYEKLGNYEKAKIAYQIALPLVDAWQEKYFPEDRVTVRNIILNKISACDINVAVYAEVPGNGGDVSYHNAKFEPQKGVYFGECYTEESQQIKGGKPQSASLVYVLFETEEIENFDWYIRPLSKTRQIIEIAWNLVHEGATLASVPNQRQKIEKAADYLKDLGTPILLRFGAEMNVWQKKADAEQFKTAFRFVSQIMKQRAPNVAMLWSPNWLGHQETTLDMFYPGDEYVDWVGLSLYTVKYFGGQDLDDKGQAMYLTNNYANPVKQLESLVNNYGSRKPIILSECGVENYSIAKKEYTTEWAKPQLRAIYDTIPIVFPQVKAILYFNTKPVEVDSQSRFSLYDNKEMESLYKELTLKPHFIPAGKDSADVSYKKLGTVTLPANKVTLAVYAPYLNKGTLSAVYRLDGTVIGGSNTVPYRYLFDFSKHGDGMHKLTVEIKAASGQPLKTETFNLRKSGASVNIEKAQ